MIPVTNNTCYVPLTSNLFAVYADTKKGYRQLAVVVCESSPGEVRAERIADGFTLRFHPDDGVNSCKVIGARSLGLSM